MHRYKNSAKAVALALGCLFCAKLFSQEGAQQQRSGPPTVAIMEPFVVSSSSKKMPVKAFEKFTLRMKLSEYLTRSKRYRILDNANTDKIANEMAKEQNFQREGEGGTVDHTKIKEVGKLMGVDYVCTLEMISNDAGTFAVLVNLIDVATAETPFDAFYTGRERSLTALNALADEIGKSILNMDEAEREMSEAEETEEKADKADKATVPL
jgi:hypothetical protein